jgi:hypothetical protein
MYSTRTTQEIRVEEKKEEFLCPFSWSVHHNLARDGYIEFTCCFVQALNLFLNEYVAEIQLSGNGIWLLSIPKKFYTEF